MTQLFGLGHRTSSHVMVGDKSVSSGVRVELVSFVQPFGYVVGILVPDRREREQRHLLLVAN